jgi:hypothetical protein
MMDIDQHSTVRVAGPAARATASERSLLAVRLCPLPTSSRRLRTLREREVASSAGAVTLPRRAARAPAAAPERRVSLAKMDRSRVDAAATTDKTMTQHQQDDFFVLF